MAATTAAHNEPANAGAPVRPLTVAIFAMGGEGGGVLADWIVACAERAGHCVQTTSVPGVAQRTGATIYYIEMFPGEVAAGKNPVLALMPVPGEVDVVIASELMEAGRAIQRGFVTPDRTTFIASTHRVYSMTEKTALADGRVDSEKLTRAGRNAAHSFVHSDFAKIAEASGSVISAALLGALAASGGLPFTREQYEDAIRQGGIGVEPSLAAFAAGFKAATEAPAQEEAQAVAAPRPGPKLTPLAKRVRNEFPAPTHEILLAGIMRLADYQDVEYAGQYLERLQAIRNFDQKSGTGDFALLRETARYLALWMSYEDGSRVADLKVRRARFERVRQEVRATDRQIVEIREFLHPGVQEISDMLPAPIARWLLGSGWAKALVERLTGKGAIVNTTSIHGFLLLRLTAAQRRWRRSTLRFREEQEKIGAWLARISALASGNYALALEVAECAQLIKGYGETHTRGVRNFEALMGAVERLRHSPKAAEVLRHLRIAALADESGVKLAEALQAVAA